MSRRFLGSVLFAAAIAVCAGLWLAGAPTPAPGKVVNPRTGAAPRSADRIVLAWGVGGVLTDDGTLWQYRPERGRWMTIDESFRTDGEERRVLPLPVPARDIRLMQGFGFLVTRSGTAWLYDLDANRWRSLGTPGR